MSKTENARPSTSGTCVAVDIGAQSVRAVEVEWSGGAVHPRLVKHGQAALPQNAWAELPASRPLFVEAIRNALAAAGISTRSAAVCLPRRLVTLRYVRLPHAPADQMRGMVTLQAQEHILFALDEVVLDYYVLPEAAVQRILGTREDLETVILTAVRRSVAADIMAVFEQVGIEVAQLSVSALALAELLADAVEPTAIIDVKPGEMDVAIVGEGIPLLTRAASLDAAGGPEVVQRRVIDEVARSLTAYQNEYRRRPVTQVLIAGATAYGLDRDILAQHLSSEMDIAVSTWRAPMGGLGGDDGANYAAALGMAASTRPTSISPINLIPGEVAERKALAARKRKQRVMSVAAVLVVGVIAFGAYNAYAANKKVQADTQDANAKLQDVQDRVSSRKKGHDDLVALDGALAQSLDRRHPMVDVLLALSSCVPKGQPLWLTQLDIARNGVITVKGDTKSETAATDYVINLQGQSEFTDIQLSYLGDSQDQNVQRSTPAPAPATPSSGTSSTPAANLPPLPGLGQGAAAPGTTPPATGTAPGTTPGTPGAPGAGGDQNTGRRRRRFGGQGFPGGGFPGGGFPGGGQGFPGGGFPGGAPGGAPGGPPPGGFPGGAPGGAPPQGGTPPAPTVVPAQPPPPPPAPGQDVQVQIAPGGLQQLQNLPPDQRKQAMQAIQDAMRAGMAGGKPAFIPGAAPATTPTAPSAAPGNTAGLVISPSGGVQRQAGAPVATTTVTPARVNPAPRTKPATVPAAPASLKSGQLTSFTITCRINPNGALSLPATLSAKVTKTSTTSSSTKTGGGK